MDCLFHDNEQQALDCYIEELQQQQNFNLIIYAAPTYEFHLSVNDFSSISIGQTSGYLGKYKGIPIYIFDGLDEHTCCVLPDFNMLPF